MQSERQHMRNAAKRLLIWILILVSIVGYAKVIITKYAVSLTIDEWNFYNNGIEAVKQNLKRSDLPARDVNFLCDSVLTKFQTELRTQIIPQLEAEKPKKDSIPPKKQ